MLARPGSSADRGFTIIEILISMMFLSLGIMGVIGFFFLAASDNRKSVRTSRATMMARTVRDALVQALRYPSPAQGGRGPRYRLELPGAVEGNGQDFISFSQGQLSGFYFQIDDVGARLYNSANVLVQVAPGAINGNMVLDLPSEGMDGNNSPVPVETWSFRDSFVREDINLPEFDDDDSQNYSFRLLIKRVVPRPGETPSSGFVTPGDIFDCTLYIYVNYFDGLIMSPPVYDPVTGDLQHIDAGGRPVPECTPVLTYRFFLSG